MKKQKILKITSNPFLFSVFFSIISLCFFLPAHAQAFKRLGVGETASEINLKDFDGKQISTSNFKNKNVLALVFFKYPSLRGPGALSYWQKLYNTYQVSNGLEILAVYCPQSDKGVTSEELEGVKKIISDAGLTFPVLIDEGLNIFGKYGVITLPSTAILDKNGIVQYILTGFPEFGAERDIRINLKKALGIPEEIVVKKEEYIPKNKADFTYKLALVVKQRGNNEKAIEHLQTAITKDPEYALAYGTLGELYVDKGEKEKAIEAFRKALTLDPDNVSILLNYGFLCMDMQKKDDALLQFKNILELDKSKIAEGLYGMGCIYTENKIYDSAKVKLEEAIKLYGGWKNFSIDEKVHFAMSYYNLGEIYSNLKDNKTAIINYQKSFDTYKELTEKLLKEKRHRAN